MLKKPLGSLVPVFPGLTAGQVRSFKLCCELAVDLSICLPVMREEVEVLALLLLRLPECQHRLLGRLLLRHDIVEVRMRLFHGLGYGFPIGDPWITEKSLPMAFRL